MPTIRVRVDCALGLVMLNRSPTNRLRRVDFPALGRPARVTMPERGKEKRPWTLDVER